MNKKDKALANCDGVIKIAQNEMLLQGEYITGVVSEKLRANGSICGGRQACLVGSMFLAHGRLPKDIDYVFSVSSWSGEMNRFDYMATRPALKLTYDAFNEAASRLLQRQYDMDPTAEPEQGWGEFYFETTLADEEHNVIREKVISLARDAKKLIKSGAVS